MPPFAEEIQGVSRLNLHDLATVENAKRLNPWRLAESVS
jgi:hypothetical protein